MRPREDALHLCVADRRCRLCQFDIEEDDSVVARINPQRLSAPWEYAEVLNMYNEVENVVFHGCFGQRCSKQNLVPFFHAECLSLRSHDLSDALIAAGEYTFDPHRYEQQQRADRVRGLLAPRLRGNLGIRLPDEVLTMIAGLLIRECATVTAQERSIGTEISGNSVDLLRGVYVTYTTVEGIRYVKGIGNWKSEDQQVLASKDGHAVQKIWIAEDYRGIRFVKFCSENTELSGPTPMKDSWWRAISAPCSINRINVKTDGLKLRDISVPEETNTDVNVEHISWTSPDHPNRILNLETLENSDDCLKGLRMISFDCNVEGTTGYTVVTDGEAITWIHAHGPDESAEFYPEMEAEYPLGFFIYMPLDDGEFITEICRRYLLDPGSDPSICLVFITNKGRATQFGTTRPPNSLNNLERILKPSPNGSKVFFNAWNSVDDEKVKYLAFDNPESPVPRALPLSLIPDPPHFMTESKDLWFKSSCSLERIVEMTFCRDISYSNTIIGVLFTYEDGHRECLGRFRFDKTLETIRVDQTSDIHIGSLRNMFKCLYVTEFGLSPPHTQVFRSWMKVSRTGTLEWWWSFRHSVVRHISAEGITSNIFGPPLHLYD
ncbi:hypothetical protein F53441_9641 [Fusarium austroafricanum]|uniref:Uncharacterized protein n=1 Tax=Fusarium austroafricanum TaxID=2364996 RepID=A0A8H4KBZ9_9HYPO|nr:hypothetical protein F53441_9641 [Fusarium austroafricanum]